MDSAEVPRPAHTPETGETREASPPSPVVQEVALLSSFLRTAREDASFTIEDAAHAVGIDQERLARIEIGATSPTADELNELCIAYECDIDSIPQADDFLPRLPSRAFVDGDLLILGPLVIPLVTEPANSEILGDVAGAIRQMRRLDPEAPVHLRKSEIPMIAEAIDLACANLPLEIAKTLRISAVESYELVEALKNVDRPLADAH